MFLAIAALLIQPAVAAQLSFSAEKIALIQPASPGSSSDAAVSETSLPLRASFYGRVSSAGRGVRFRCFARRPCTGPGEFCAGDSLC